MLYFVISSIHKSLSQTDAIITEVKQEVKAMYEQQKFQLNLIQRLGKHLNGPNSISEDINKLLSPDTYLAS